MAPPSYAPSSKGSVPVVPRQQAPIDRRWIGIVVLVAFISTMAGVLIGASGSHDRLVTTAAAAVNRDGERQRNGREPGDEAPRAAPRSELSTSRTGFGAPESNAARQSAAEQGSGAQSQGALLQEVAQLKRRAREAQQALNASNERLSQLETSRRSRSDPRQFDLSPADWRQLGQQGTLKLRVPCATSGPVVLSPAQLELLGLDASDAPVVVQALQHSADRMWAALGPLCADALGITPEQAAQIGTRDCRHHILGRAAQKGTALTAFRRVAAYLAGDASEPPRDDPVVTLVLALSQEQGLIEAELSQHFGPDEADRLVFSRGLCFTEATHELAAGAATPADDSVASPGGRSPDGR